MVEDDVRGRPDEPWPPSEALRWLDDFERDPRDWHWTDLQGLLDRWGITERLPGEDPAGYHVRIYRAPDGRTFYFSYKEWPECPPPVITGICGQLRTILRHVRRGSQ